MSRHCRNNHCHSGTHVRRYKMLSMQEAWTGNNRPMWIAQGNSRTHAYKLVHKEHPAFKHLFKNQNGSFNLGCNHRHYRSQIRRESRPRTVINFRNHSAKVIVYPHFLTGRYSKCISLNVPAYAQLAERNAQRPHVLWIDTGNRD